jgi:hypothetical protein
MQSELADGHGDEIADPSFMETTFLPGGKNIVSSLLGAREDVVSPPGNGFLSFLSLSSFIDLPHQYFCLGGNLFNAHRNYHKYPLGVP